MTTSISLEKISEISLPMCEYCLREIADALAEGNTLIYNVSGPTNGCYENHYYRTIEQARKIRDFFNK